ncbi:MAG: TolC family protein, partial [Pseudomonadota bacterium]
AADSLTDQSTQDLKLLQLIDIALKNNPSTRIAWAQAKAAAASWGMSRSTYYPEINGTVSGAAGRIPALQGGSNFVSTDLNISYLLFDFGGRGAKAKAAKEALIAANWSHNQAIQDLLRDVPTAYNTYLANVALQKAQVKNLDEANMSLAATELRRKSGVSTLADVLLARSKASQVKVNLAQAKGAVMISQGDLARVVGWPANMQFSVHDELKDLPVEKVDESVDGMIEIAKVRRPALNQAFSTLKQKESELTSAKRAPFPTLTGSGDFSWTKMRNNQNTGMYGGVQLNIPIFKGFEYQNAIKKAKADLQAAQAEFENTEESVIADVWNAYYNFKTSAEQLIASKSLLESSTESYKVSLARYKEGAAEITELLDAQSTLANARAQLIDARTSLYNSFVALMHAMGSEMDANNSTSTTYDTIQERNLTDEKR